MGFRAALLIATLAGLFALDLSAPRAVAATDAEASLSAQDQADVERVEDYLDGIRSLRSPFLQINPDGSMAEGTFYLKRPGRLRFDYDPPTPVLIVGDGIYLHYRDFELGQINSFPLRETPIGILARDEIRLKDRVKVTAVVREPGLLRLTLVDAKDPGRGSLTLSFADSPLELRQWTVKDAQGRITTLAFLDLEANPALEGELFVFDDPRKKITPGRAPR